MSKHNYSQYSNKKKDNRTEGVNEVRTKRPEVKPVMDEAPKTAVYEPKPQIIQETVETVTLPEMVEGVVTGCAKLNVRAEASIAADVVCVLNSMDELEVDVMNSNNEWVKICTAFGIEGYCMRKYIDVRL